MRNNKLIKKIVLLIFIIGSYNIFGQFAPEISWTTGQGIGGSFERHWIGDFNGDGMDDKLQLAGDNNWYVALSLGRWFDGERNWTKTSDPYATKYYVGDFTGDGLDDIISFRTTTGTWKVSLAYQEFYNEQPLYKFENPQQWNSIGSNLFGGTAKQYVGDFNGDGYDDILVYQSGWKVALSDGTTFIKTQWGNKYPGTYSSSNPIHIGDFNGDSYDDIAIYKSSGYSWYVGTSNGSNGFNTFQIWCCGQGYDNNGMWMRDLNGDGKEDKIHNVGNGEVWIAISSGTNFYGETRWTYNQGGGHSVYVGDFNGDRLCDLVTYNSNGVWSVGLNISPIPTPNHERIVATWFLPFYKQGFDNGLYDSKRDPDKRPVVGWNTGTQSGFYNSDDLSILSKQIDAMHDAGINLIIVDNTNGWFSPGTDYCRDNIIALFTAMRNKIINDGYCIPIAIALGYEYWGKETITAYSLYQDPPIDPEYWDWSILGGWPTQYVRQQVALNDIYTNFYQNYTDIYFRYLGRPLVITYLENGADYPPREDDGRSRALWQDKRFTLIPAINWNNTYGYGANGGVEPFKNGQATKKTWGWGAEWDISHSNPICHVQPYNAECMSLMPGTYCWTIDPPDIVPSRDGGNYYITSWKNIIAAMPNIALIGGWNNWNEETAIEGCQDNDGLPILFGSGWNDYNGHAQPDWYLQITQSYSSIFKNGVIPSGTYVRDENNANYYYYWDGISATSRTSITNLPDNKPIIVLPHWFVVAKGLSLNKNIVGDNEISDINFYLNAYPNPFNPSTKIEYSIPQKGSVTLKIFDLLGSEIETLLNEEMEPGYYSINWSPNTLSSGIYIYSLSCNQNMLNRKIVYIK